MSTGFLYVLINPSMPGLAKVGKTTRDPTNRVAELSSATGVPAPFILAFQQPVDNCHYAERWVHSMLERDGYRASENREFFTAPLHEIVRIVSEAATLSCGAPENSDMATVCDDESPEWNPGLELFNLGWEFDRGTERSLPNQSKAIEAFAQSAALGFGPSCELLGTYYLHGSGGARQDAEKALAFFLKAVDAGSWWCLAGAGQVFQKNGQLGTAEQYWLRFFERAVQEVRRAGEVGEVRSKLVAEKIGAYGVDYCMGAVVNHEIAHCVPDATLLAVRSALITTVERMAALWGGEGDLGLDEVRKLQMIEAFLDGLATPATATTPA